MKGGVVWLWGAWAAWAACPAGAAAATVAPVCSFELLGGQYFFSGQRAGLSGNASALVAPAVALGDSVRLIPVFSSRYQGTKQVVDLVGAGSLFQEQMEHRASLRAVLGAGGGSWRFKPNVSYQYHLLKETKDEAWARGLFDSWRVSGGLEVEYVYRRPYSVRVAVDDFYTAFPNYTSLESQVGLDLQGQPLARELAGRRVLNSHSQSALLGASAPLGSASGEAQLALQRTRFTDQRLVDRAGALGFDAREDYLTSLSLSLRRPAVVSPSVRLVAAVDLAGAYNASNQSSYDARRARYLDGYYDYGELRAGLGGQLLLGDSRRPAVCSLGGAWTARSYPRRHPQDEAGEYGAGGTRQRTWVLSSSVRYPLAERLRLVFDLHYGRAGSNQRYAQGYSYRYAVANYLFGVSYDY
ncbi:MAG: hypothetical protein HY554_02255 [Elusimicrobia bacterium]|nr:hypothetical protein [Elusimicrobiota bacterium]